jgi:hypothetical protein
MPQTTACAAEKACWQDILFPDLAVRSVSPNWRRSILAVLGIWWNVLCVEGTVHELCTKVAGT